MILLDAVYMIQEEQEKKTLEELKTGKKKVFFYILEEMNDFLTIWFADWKADATSILNFWLAIYLFIYLFIYVFIYQNFCFVSPLSYS